MSAFNHDQQRRLDVRQELRRSGWRMIGLERYVSITRFEHGKNDDIERDAFRHEDGHWPLTGIGRRDTGSQLHRELTGQVIEPIIRDGFAVQEHDSDLLRDLPGFCRKGDMNRLEGFDCTCSRKRLAQRRAQMQKLFFAHARKIFLLSILLSHCCKSKSEQPRSVARRTSPI